MIIFLMIIFYSLMLKFNFKGGGMMVDKEKFERTTRINIRVTNEVNSYLDEKSARTGLSKSALAYLMLENQIKQESMMDVMPKLIKEVEDLKSKID